MLYFAWCGELHEVAGDEAEETWAGRFDEGDEVLRVTKLEPILPGSLTFENRDPRPDKAVLVFAEDVRMGLRAPSDGDADGDAVAGDFVHTLAPRVGTRHNPAFPRLTLTAAAHSTILQIQRHDLTRRRMCGVVALRKVADEQKCAWLLEAESGKHLTTFAASSAGEEMWLDANEALTAFKDTEFNSVCAITVSGST